MKTETVSIIGLDRISASIGLALRESDLGLSVQGHVRDKGAAKLAQELGVVDRTTGSLVKAAQSADILIINTPYSEHEVTLEVVGSEVRDHTLILDLSNLKSVGLKLADRYVMIIVGFKAITE